MIVAVMTGPGSVSVVLTATQRDAILEEIEFVFELAGDLPFMLEHANESERERDDARELVSRLHVSVSLLDQLGWEPRGERDSYVVEVDDAVESFADRMERFARAGLEHNRPRLVSSDERVRATTRRLIDADLEKLRAARVLRTAFRVTRKLDASLMQSPQLS
jgi:hypothetical protein